MDPYVGEIKILPWDWAPKSWALCNGAVLSIQQNQALFSLLGTLYGGNGVTTFALPDLRSRTAAHTGTFNGVNYPQGAVTGTETVTITNATMPQHTHAFQGVTDTANRKLPGGFLIGTDTSAGTDFLSPASANTVTLNPNAVGMTGGSQPHNNMQPYLVLNYVIALQGIFPSRN